MYLQIVTSQKRLCQAISEAVSGADTPLPLPLFCAWDVGLPHFEIFFNFFFRFFVLPLPAKVVDYGKFGTIS